MRVLHVTGCIPPHKCVVGDSLVKIARLQEPLLSAVAVVSIDGCDDVGDGVETHQ